jgi:hypothetical protein
MGSIKSEVYTNVLVDVLNNSAEIVSQPSFKVRIN